MMVRAGVVLTFLVATLGSWVLMKPPSDGVSRLANGTLILPTQADVTRAAPTDPVLPSPLMASTDEHLLGDTLDLVLKKLGFDAPPAAPMRAGLLSGPPDPAEDTAAVALADLIVAGINARQTDADISAGINAAYVAGALEVPAVLVTTEGTVDVPTLLQSVVMSAKVRLGEVSAEPASAPTTHTVQLGESLAGIALSVYGDPLMSLRLLEANSDLMSSAVQMAPGMELAIPLI